MNVPAQIDAKELVPDHAANIEALKQVMLLNPDPLEVDPQNIFVPGLYARVLKMPADSVWISKIHKTEHICIALTGRATVISKERGVEEVIAPKLMITKPGTQRALYIHEESTWVTFQPTAKTDRD